MSKLRISLIVMASAVMGCVTAPKPPSPEVMLDFIANDYLTQVLSTCIELHGKALAGESPINCAYKGDLSAMWLSLPNFAYREEFRGDLLRLEQNWCGASQAKTGKPSYWVQWFRKEGRVDTSLCKRGEELRNLTASNDDE
jgi:hypothetical protein